MDEKKLSAYYDLLNDHDKRIFCMLGISVFLDFHNRISDIIRKFSDEKNN